MKILNKEDLKNTVTTFSIDRFEGNYAICEDRNTQEMVSISKALLPVNSKSGDILKFENDRLIIDDVATLKEQQEIKKLVDQLFKKKNK